MNKLKIIWKAPHPGYAYFVGDVCELPEKQAKELLKGDYVEIFTEPEPEEPVPDLPDDFPGRDALMRWGITTLAEARQIPDFTEIRGIGKSTDKMIHEYLKELEQ